MATDIISTKMDTEWRRWRRLCTHLRNRGIDINKDDQLCEDIKEWGDALVALRDEQGVPVEIETYHPGTPREDGRGIDAPPNTLSTGRLEGVRVHIALHRDNSVGVGLRTEEHPYDVPQYALAEVVRAALK